MVSNEVKNALNNIHNNFHINNNITQTKDKTYKYGKVRGLQIVIHYFEKWGLIIPEICEENNIHLNINANAETKNQAKNIKIINEMVKIINEKMPMYGKDRIFTIFLDIYPEFLRQKATNDFKQWLNQPGIKRDIERLLSIPGIENLFNGDGITEETDKHISEYVSNIIKTL